MVTFIIEKDLTGLEILQKILLAYARLNISIPGKKSAYRKFCRRRKGNKYRIRTKHGFVFEGVIGDSVDSKIFVYREFEPVDFMKIDIEGYEAKVFQSISPKVAKRIKSFVIEYSEKNLEQCGSSKEDLDYIEWLNQFELFRLDEQTGEIQPLDSIESFPFLEEVLLACSQTEFGNKLNYLHYFVKN